MCSFTYMPYKYVHGSIKIENTLLLCIASQLCYDHKVTSAATCIVKELLDDIVNPVN